MAKVRVRKETGHLYFDFYFQGKRCREQTVLNDTVINRKRAAALAERIKAAITLGSFRYRDFFPNSPRAAQFDEGAPKGPAVTQALENQSLSSETPLFQDFVESWWELHKVTLRFKTRESYRGTIDRYLIPHLGRLRVGEIRKSDVLQLRSALAKVPGRNGNDTLSAKTINYTLGVLRTVLTEAADEYHFSHPMQNIKRLKQKKPEIQPFSLVEVKRILATVRKDYTDYFTVRFFTGMRTGEIHGLRWKNVDFDRGVIKVRETHTRAGVDDTKTAESVRDIEMSTIDRQALERQKKVTGQGDYVFCTSTGTPFDAQNLTNRVWYPLLRYLELDKRRPYQCRHTAATLWLASGENPQWIAYQLGHTTPEMLFRVYARFVPNLTRQDGSAMDRLLRSQLEVDNV